MSDLKTKFGAMGVLLVAWIFPSFHLLLVFG
jgi:hypothetical protein